MIIEINEYYKLEIDKAKEVMVKEDYTLKSPYILLCMHALVIIYNITLFSSNLHKMVIILYTIPLFIGVIYEYYKLKQYKKSEVGKDTIKQILKLLSIRVVNIMFFMLEGFLVCVQVAASKMYFYVFYVDQINTILTIAFFISIIMMIPLFFLGVVIGKRQVIKHKKKGFVLVLIIGVLVGISFFFFEISTFSIVVIISVISFFCLPFSIGKSYFRYKNFDKKITEEDNMIDYKL